MCLSRSDLRFCDFLKQSYYYTQCLSSYSYRHVSLDDPLFFHVQILIGTNMMIWLNNFQPSLKIVKPKAHPLQAVCMKFLNTLVSMTEGANATVFLQQEMTHAGFELDVLQK
ncbi:unnamed protein product, partial [Owenia fusiformis]